MYFEKIRDVLAKQFELDPETITAETNLIDDIGADSLDVVELIMALEDEFGVKISDDDAAKLTTVGRIFPKKGKETVFCEREQARPRRKRTFHPVSPIDFAPGHFYNFTRLL